MTHYSQTFTTEADARAFIEREIRCFIPAGYGTRFAAPVRQGNGLWLVTGSRANSCD